VQETRLFADISPLALRFATSRAIQGISVQSQPTAAFSIIMADIE
jgi:hypothetical protein